MTTSSPSSDRVGIRRHNEINLNDYRVNFCDLFLVRFCVLLFPFILWNQSSIRGLLFISFSQNPFQTRISTIEWVWASESSVGKKISYFDVKTKLSLNIWKQLLCWTNGMIFIVGVAVVVVVEIIIIKIESNRTKKKNFIA